jgi:hypothetical protein
MLAEDTITFGKYNGLTLDKLLRDRKYCSWLLTDDQSWFKEKYEFLYNRIKEYNPSTLFLPKITLMLGEAIDHTDFCKRYEYFNLTEPSILQSKLNDTDYKSYHFYYTVIQGIKEQIFQSMSYDIKSPTKWLIKFETETKLSRDILKEFLEAHDLLNIICIVERIKKEGGIDFKGAKSFIIAKERSVKQETFWEEILKGIYGEDVSVQFKYQKCIFDFIHINKNTLYECKLSFKDFSPKQYRKYLQILDNYNIIYLIGYETVVNFENKCIYTISDEPVLISTCSEEFSKLLSSFEVIKIKDKSFKSVL